MIRIKDNFESPVGANFNSKEIRQPNKAPQVRHKNPGIAKRRIQTTGLNDAAPLELPTLPIQWFYYYLAPTELRVDLKTKKAPQG